MRLGKYAVTRRRAARIDANQNPIARALVAVGYSVLDLHLVGGGVPDVLVAGTDRRTGMKRMWLMEIKTDKGKVEKNQTEWHEAWRGPPVHVVRSVEEAYAIVGVV